MFLFKTYLGFKLLLMILVDQVVPGVPLGNGVTETRVCIIAHDVEVQQKARKIGERDIIVMLDLPRHRTLA